MFEVGDKVIVSWPADVWCGLATVLEVRKNPPYDDSRTIYIVELDKPKSRYFRTGGFHGSALKKAPLQA